LTGLDLDAFERTIKKFPVKAIVVIPNFNNPLGGCMPDESKRSWWIFATREKIPLIEDDTYGELYFGKSRPRPCKFYDTRGWVMYLLFIVQVTGTRLSRGMDHSGKFTETAKQIKRYQNISSPTLTPGNDGAFSSIWPL